MVTPSVLFVCLGNICRSPLAEAAFRRAADDAGFAVEADSAGTGDWHIGHAPDPRAQAVAKANGIDISGYRARRIEPADFSRFDEIVALDASNLADIRALTPADATARISLLLDHVPGREGQGVADPYCGDAAGFDTTWCEVEEGAAGLLTHMRGDQPSG